MLRRWKQFQNFVVRQEGTGLWLLGFLSGVLLLALLGPQVFVDRTAPVQVVCPTGITGGEIACAKYLHLAVEQEAMRDAQAKGLSYFSIQTTSSSVTTNNPDTMIGEATGDGNMWTQTTTTTTTWSTTMSTNHHSFQDIRGAPSRAFEDQDKHDDTEENDDEDAQNGGLVGSGRIRHGF